MTGLYSLFCGNKTCRIIRAVDEWSIRGSRGEQNAISEAMTERK